MMREMVSEDVAAAVTRDTEGEALGSPRIF